MCITSTESSPEFNGSSSIQGATLTGVDDLEPMPLDIFAEVDGCWTGRRVPTREEERAVEEHIGRIPRPHRFLRGCAQPRGSLAMKSAAAISEGFPGATWAALNVDRGGHDVRDRIGGVCGPAGTVERTMSGSETQDQILDAVQSVIVREGVSGASMRQVAQEADVSLGLLSYHFDDKDNLIFAAFDRASTTLREASVDAAAAVDDPDEKVVAFLRGGFAEEFLASDYLRLRISLWAVALTDTELAKVDAEYYKKYSQSLRALIASARPALDPDVVAARTADVIALTNGLWLDWARYHNSDDLERGLLLSESIALAPA